MYGVKIPPNGVKIPCGVKIPPNWDTKNKRPLTASSYLEAE